MAGISSKAAGSITNKYKFGGKEMQNQEFSDGSGLEQYDFGARNYDPQIGRWHNIDPLASQFSWQSPYVAMDNDPINTIDPTGAESEHINERGDVLLHKDDGDNSVFVHTGGTTATVEKSYTSENHSAGGQKIGELGVNIDITTIAANLLKDNKAVSQIINKDEWVAKVLPNQVWDLKNNTATIFGVAWQFDADAQSAAPEGTTLRHTSFNMGGTSFQDAAAFGNYHAGYTGTHAALSRRMQYTFAGLGEVAKFHGDNIRRLTEIKNGTAPFGDQPIDFRYNTQGMNAADAEIRRDGRPVRPTHANPIRRSGSYYPYN